MSGQAEIIVRGEINDFFAIERADGCLLVVQHAQLEVRAFRLEFVQLVGEVRERICAGCGRHKCLEKVLRRGFTRVSADSLALLVYLRHCRYRGASASRSKKSPGSLRTGAWKL